MVHYRTVWKQVLQSTKSTETTWPYIGPTLAICGALLWGTAMVYASMYARLPVPNANVKVWVIALGAVAGLFVASGAFGSAKRHVLLWPPIFIGGLVLGGSCVWYFGVAGVTRMGEQAQQAFVDERREFASSPTGFQYLADTARSTWSLDIELNDAGASSNVAADLDGSPATVEIHPGFCAISVAPRMTERFVGAAEASEYRQDVLWVAAAREVGRCYDVSRDEYVAGKPGTAFRSLAPADAVGIASVHDYFAATKRETTRQWRERYADIFAVGWMRLARPQYAQQLADTLRHEHEVNDRDESQPQTSCAIASAMQSTTPASLEDLPTWADRIRSASCAR